jgi:sRNA-binding protein
MKTNLIIILLVSFFSSGLYAQLDDNLKAKLYFTEAEKLFKQGDFKNSLVYVDKAENTLGTSVARTLALRIKLAYNLGKFTQAKELFDTYTSKYMDGASKELNDEVLAMFINVEEGGEAEKKRQAEAKAAEERRKAEHERRQAEAKAAEERRRAELEKKEAEDNRKAKEAFRAMVERKAEISKLESEAFIITVKGQKLKVYPIDLGKMNWYDADKACKELGSGGWRLPTKKELNSLYSQLYKKKLGGLRGQHYWSSDKYDKYHAWGAYFGYKGKGGNYDVKHSILVRPVRDF